MNLILAGLTTYRGRVSTLKRCSRYFSKKKGSFITLIYPYKDMFSPKYEHYSSPQILIVTYPPFFRSKLIFQAKIFECQQHFVFRSKRVWSPHGDKALNSPFSAGQYFHWELNICFVLVNPCEKIYFFPWWFVLVRWNTAYPCQRLYSPKSLSSTHSGNSETATYTVRDSGAPLSL